LNESTIHYLELLQLEPTVKEAFMF